MEDYFQAAFGGGSSFVPGVTPVPVSGKVFGPEEMVSLVDSALDFWLTTGRYAEEFERRFAKVLGLRYALLANSGSSANLLAVSALTAPSLGDRRLTRGDEVIATAASFPTTVNPIIQNGLVPVLVDVDIPSYNAALDQIEAAITSRTKAIFLAHTLGNPFDLERIAKIARDRGLWLIEDCCDALGATFTGRPVSTFGDIGTFSFYPAHHITTGEGGAVATNDHRLKKLLESFRDWGRDCWCAPGKDDTCGKRFRWKMGQLPEGYDHKYVYSHAGYNLKATDMQAAVGCAQLSRLDGFVKTRNKNFQTLLAALRRHEEFLILPESHPKAQPSWFGFPITVREGAPFDRRGLTTYLESRRIGTRPIFAGNLVRQPYFAGVEHRQVGNLQNADRVMCDSFWIGVYPGLTDEMLGYVVERIEEYLTSR